MKLFYGIIIDMNRPTGKDSDFYEQVYPYHQLENFADEHDLSDEYKHDGIIGVTIYASRCMVDGVTPQIFDPIKFNELVEEAKNKLTPKLIKKIQRTFKTKNEPKLYYIH